MKMINYTEHTIKHEDIDAVSNVMQNEHIAGNSRTVQEFEDALCAITGYKFCLATNSATTALLVAFNSKWPESGLITMSSLTFVATANMLACSGHQIIAVDVNLNSRVSHGASVGTSFGGHPVMGCQIADDAHSLIEGMSEIGNETSVVSFHPAKIITTGEGGAILTNSERVYMSAQKLVDQGRLDRQGEFGYGFNFRMPGLNAALGLSQIKRLASNHQRRRFIVEQYRKELRQFSPHVNLPKHHPLHSYHLFNILLPSRAHRNELRDNLHKHGIGTQIHYPPLHEFPHLTGRINQTGSRNSRLVYENGVSLPLHLNLTNEELDFILDRLVFFLRRMYG